VSSYQLLGTQTPSTLLHGSHREFRLQATENVQCQAASMPVGTQFGILGVCEKGRSNFKEAKLLLFFPQLQTSNTLLYGTRLEFRYQNAHKIKNRTVQKPEVDICDSWSIAQKGKKGDNEPKSPKAPRMHLQPQSRFSLLLACSLRHTLIKIYKARRRACRDGGVRDP